MTKAFPRHLIAVDRSDTLCHKGSRLWCEQVGISWNEFVFEGLDTEVLRATGDRFAIMVAERAEKEAKNE